MSLIETPSIAGELLQEKKRLVRFEATCQSQQRRIEAIECNVLDAKKPNQVYEYDRYVAISFLLVPFLCSISYVAVSISVFGL
jgi:hypothetical protein